MAAVAPSRLPEFFQEIQDAFTQPGDEDSVFPIRHFYQRWGAAIAIERRPSVAARLHAAEQALADAGLAPRRLYCLTLDELWRVLNLGGSMADRVNELTRLRTKVFLSIID